MAVDKKRVTELLEHLDEQIRYIEKFRVGSPKVLEESKKDFFALKNLLYEAVMDVIKISQHTIAALQLEKPRTYRETLHILGENNIIPMELAQRIEKIGGFRVILAHEYERVTPEYVYKLHLRTDDLREFVKAMARFLESS